LKANTSNAQMYEVNFGLDNYSSIEFLTLEGAQLNAQVYLSVTEAINGGYRGVGIECIGKGQTNCTEHVYEIRPL